MNLIKQGAAVFILLQLLFGYIEYRYKPDLLYILGRLFNPKYVFPSLIIPITYIVLAIILRFLFS